MKKFWNFLQNWIQNFNNFNVIWLIHSWEIALQSQNFDIVLKKGQKINWMSKLNVMFYYFYSD